MLVYYNTVFRIVYTVYTLQTSQQSAHRQTDRSKQNQSCRHIHITHTQHYHVTHIFMTSLCVHTFSIGRSQDACENCGRNFAKRKQSDAVFAGKRLLRMVVIDIYSN